MEGVHYSVQDHGDSSSDTESVSSSHIERKKRKPLMEKKRRARINASLEQLKKLVLDAMKKDSARYSKLEKADILELTVRHLRESQQHQMSAAMVHDSSVVGKYKAGFSECASEVSRYLATIDGLSHDVRLRMMQHLSHCVQKVELSSSSVSKMAAGYPMMHQQQQSTGLQQPLQIQIPMATQSSTLPGMSYVTGSATTRCSPEPGNLPPTPPSSAEHSFNGSFQFNAPSMTKGQYTLLPLQVQGQVPMAQVLGQLQVQPSEAPLAVSSPNPLPLRSSENITKLPSAHANYRYSPYGMKLNVQVPGERKSVSPVGVPIKDESMWRPW